MSGAVLLVATARKPPLLFGVTSHRALLWSSFGVLCGLMHSTRASDLAPALVDRQVQYCALRLALPANWTLQAKRQDGVCVVTASEPPHASRCVELGDDKKVCQADHRIVISVQRGSIEDLTQTDATDISPFAFRDGKWQFRDDWSEHETTSLQHGPYKILVADYATRDYYEDGGYCCVGRVWWALADLPAHRVARVEMSWDAISWDDDTTSWDDATDRRSRGNVESFLRSLQ